MFRKFFIFSRYASFHRQYFSTKVIFYVKASKTQFYTLNSGFVTKRTLCQSNRDNRSEESLIDTEDDGVLENSARTIIQYSTADPIISALIECTSLKTAFDTFEEHKASFRKEHLVQLVFVLWHFLNIYLKVQTQMGTITDSTASDYLLQLKDHSSFQEALSMLEDFSSTLSTDELTCSLLYLSKMEVDLKSTVMASLISSIEDKFRIEQNEANWTALSRFCVALKYDSELWSQFLLLNITPLVGNKIVLGSPYTPEEFRLMTICLLHTNYLIPRNCLSNYKKLCESFVATTEITHESARAMVKALSFLSLPFWSHENISLARKIAFTLKDFVGKMELKDVVTLTKAFHIHLEPACIELGIREAIKNYFNSSNPVFDKEINVSALSCAAQLANHQAKKHIKELLHQELNSGYFFNTMNSLFQILRTLKTSDRKLCDEFWDKSTDALRKPAALREIWILHRAAMRYMYFNNNMGGTYRHIRFEKQMTCWIAEEIESGISSYTPNKLVKGVSFLLAYCRNSQTLVSAIDRLLSMKTQLQKIDCVLLSRGVEIMLELTRRRQISPVVMEKLVELDTCLNECAWRHLEEKNLPMGDLVSLLRTYHNRRGNTNSLLLHTIAERLDSCSDVICSRSIRDVSYCLTGLSCLLPNLLDRIAHYIVENEDSVLAETAERVISTSFHLGYMPSVGEEFLDACARLLVRDMERLSGLVTIQMSLALSFFHRFPSDIVGKLFSVEFLERIDEELACCYSKASYPVRVRYALMELNRSVCLDLPQLDVPWFHTKYCEEISTLDPIIDTPVHQNVYKHLAITLGSEKFIQSSSYSPYGYKINFLVLLDDLGKPLTKNEEKLSKQKLAIIIHSDQQFAAYTRNLKGQQQMRQRHLEIMGYRVIPIPERTWNSMFLTETHAKKAFLSKKIWPER